MRHLAMLGETQQKLWVWKCSKAPAVWMKMDLSCICVFAAEKTFLNAVAVLDIGVFLRKELDYLAVGLKLLWDNSLNISLVVFWQKQLLLFI